MLRKLVRALCISTSIASAADPQLVKVFGLGRHGNREANAEVDYLCPKAQAYIPLVGIGTNWEAALTTSGEVQCMMAGRFLHQRYVRELGHLPEHAGDDHTTLFYADASDRNIVCLDIAKRSLFTGPRAGDWSLGNGSVHNPVIPVKTTKLGHDTVMRLPRYHQCERKVKRDAMDFGVVDEPTFKRDHSEFLAKLGDACGFDFDKLICGDEENGIFGGKCLSWGIKNVHDAFSFAKYEGHDWTLGGKLSEADLKELGDMAAHLLNSQNLRLDSQITYTAGEFPTKALFANMKKPEPGQTKSAHVLQDVFINKDKHPWDPTPLEFYYHNKFLLFWNHRELITGLLMMFNGVNASGQPISPFPRTGSMVIWEVWEDNEGLFLRYYMWELNADPDTFMNRSLPWPHVKPGTLDNVASVSTGMEIFPSFCEQKGRCTIEEFEAAHDAWIEKTGTWQEICGVEEEGSAELLAGARAEAKELRQELEALRLHTEMAARTGSDSHKFASGYLVLGCAAATAAVLMAVAMRLGHRLHLDESLETGYTGIAN